MPSPRKRALLHKPIFILGCNRSGTTLLFRNLGGHPDVWTQYEEAQDVYYRWFPIDAEQGDRVDRPPTKPEGEGIAGDLYEQAHNKELHRDVPLLRHLPRKLIQRPMSRPFKRPPIRLVEKTPANSLRIPLLAALFPDACFIHLVRRPEAVISSLMEGWKRWSGVEQGESWVYTDWHYIVPPGWQEWKTHRLEEICAFQWVRTNEIALADLEEHCPGRHTVLRHEDALAKPETVYERLLYFCELRHSDSFRDLVRRSDERVFTHGGSEPRRDKWRVLHEEEVESVRPMFEPLAERLYGDSVTWAN